jgi:hypothetical protein
VLKCKLCESVTLFKDSYEAVGDRLFDGRGLVGSCIACFGIGLGLGGLALSCLTVGRTCGSLNLYLFVGDYTEYGISDDLLMCTGNGMVCIVSAVDVTRDSVRLTVVEVLKAEDRTGTVYLPGISRY